MCLQRDLELNAVFHWCSISAKDIKYIKKIFAGFEFVQMLVSEKLEKLDLDT